MCLDVIGKVRGMAPFRIDNKDGVAESTGVRLMLAGNDFINVMGIKLKKGRDFSKILLTDAGDTYIVNETLVKKMGWNSH